MATSWTGKSGLVLLTLVAAGCSGSEPIDPGEIPSTPAVISAGDTSVEASNGVAWWNTDGDRLVVSFTPGRTCDNHVAIVDEDGELGLTVMVTYGLEPGVYVPTTNFIEEGVQVSIAEPNLDDPPPPTTSYLFTSGVAVLDVFTDEHVTLRVHVEEGPYSVVGQVDVDICPQLP